MPKQTYSQLAAQIEQLQRQADALREAEKAGVVARISEAIRTWQLTHADLFGKPRGKVRDVPRKQSQAKSKMSGMARFADGEGNEWVGRGPRPRWVRDALAAGRQLQDFAVTGAHSKGAADPLAERPKGRLAAVKAVGAKRAGSTKAVVRAVRKGRTPLAAKSAKAEQGTAHSLAPAAVPVVA